jgi:elongation factor G
MIDNQLPSPLVCMAIEPRSRTDQGKLGMALAHLAADDMSFRVSMDPESGQTILEGTSEQHLNSKLDVLRRGYAIDVNIGLPQVIYRERITKKVTVDYTHKKQTGGTGQFAAVKIVAEPLPLGTGFEFENEIIGGAVPKEFIPGIETGLESVLGAGIVAGFPVVDLKVTLVDGKYHDVDSSALAFEIAARMALREALQQGDSVLLELIMMVEVTTPQDCAASVVRDLGSRRARIRSQSPRDDAVAIAALVPLATMFGYHNALRAIGQDRATFTMQFDHYAPVHLPEPPPFRPAIGMRG